MDTLVKNPVHHDQAHKGLTVRRQGECLEAVNGKSVTARLLTAHQQVEVVEDKLEKRLTFEPFAR